jgi:phosphoglycolate phosphatase-like HAD superfamily hydrolase
MTVTQRIALDFDGVLCNGLAEYFQTTCQAYAQIWSPLTDGEPWRSRFYRCRPIIESGWEMPVLLHALVQGYTDSAILTDWPTLRDHLLREADFDRAQLAPIVDAVRDRAIQDDLSAWLALHQFYPGVIAQLQSWCAQPDLEVWIVSTKEGRFIDQLLHAQQVHLPRSRILGKEVKQSKLQTIQQLWRREPHCPLTFVEDRVPPLTQIAADPDLGAVRLFLATWGYNTESMRDRAAAQPTIQLLDLEQFGAIAMP